MTLFTQMFRYAFEPFLFSVYKDKDSPQTYASVMKYFVISALLIFLGTTLYIDVIQVMLGTKLRGGLAVVPIVLIGYLFLGIYYNLSVWYKVKDLTRYASVMACVGAAITLILNWILIPKIGYMGSAWATLACYLVMMIVSYFWGRRFFPVPYEIGRILLWIGAAIGIYILSVWLRPEQLVLRLVLNTVLVSVFIGIIALFEKTLVNTVLGMVRHRSKQ